MGDSVDFVDPSFCFREDTWWKPLTCLSVCLFVAPFPAESTSIIYRMHDHPSLHLSRLESGPTTGVGETANNPYRQMGGALFYRWEWL